MTMPTLASLVAIAALALAGCSKASAQPDHAQAATSHEHMAQNTPAAAGYHCPMHADVRSDKPGSCSKCGMKLVPDEK